MKVSELIGILRNMPQDIEVIVDGYEDGYDPVRDVVLKHIQNCPENPDFSGRYDDIGCDELLARHAVLIER